MEWKKCWSIFVRIYKNILKNKESIDICDEWFYHIDKSYIIDNLVWFVNNVAQPEFFI